MPFGQFKGQKLANVPAHWLLWAYDNIPNLRADLKLYIEDNKQALQQEKKLSNQNNRR